MTLEELKPFLKKGKTGIIPRWIGYLKWDYGINQVKFINQNYTMSQDELEGNYGIANRTDLYYIT